jgi:hypothetical protein
VARWPFFVGDVLVLAIAWIAVSRGEAPPGLGAIIVAFVCVLIGVALAIAPFLLDYDARLRLAEAAAREANEAQARRLAQTAEQLAHAVSRSQSTEEQAGHALGTLEEMADKLTAHAEELAQSISRAAEREQASQKGEIERLVRERDDALAALDNRVSAVAAALAEAQAATKKAGLANSRALDEIKHRLDELAERVATLGATTGAPSNQSPASFSQPASAPAGSPTRVDEMNEASSSVAITRSTPGISETASKPAEKLTAPATESAPSSTASSTAPTVSAGHVTSAKNESAEKTASSTTTAHAHTPSPAKETERTAFSAADTGAAPASSSTTAPRAAPKSAPKPDHLELPLEGMPEPRPVTRHSRRDSGAGITSLVATAYIGIGNKLFLRGEGPGLSWESGVPMQFLAIGKWGWTTTDATAAVTCRVYRNDDTPMLDENIVIAPGAKTEIAPRF